VARQTERRAELSVSYERVLTVPDRFYEIAAERLLAGPTAPPHVLFAGVDDDLWVWLHVEGPRRVPELMRILPGYPDEAIQHWVHGVAGDDALRDGFVVYRLVREAHRANGGELATSRVLDLGSGWGRVLRFFLRDVPGDRLVGADASADLVRLSEELNPWCSFAHVAERPPTQFADGSFDLVFAYSLFSHLSESAHIAWMTEIARITRADATVVVTTWGRDLIERCDALRRRSDLQPHERHLATLFDPSGTWIAEYEAGLFCFGQSSDVYGDRATSFGEAVVPEAWIRDRWPKELEVLHFVDDRRYCQQALVVARRR
jgi:hypothetical protein